MKYLIDTDVLIWILRGNEDVIKALSSKVGKAKPFISAISVAEVFNHVLPHEANSTEEFLKSHYVLGVDYKIAKTAGIYFEDYGGGKNPVWLLDCLIASSAKVHSLAVLTYNLDHFPMKDIKVDKP